LTTDSDFDQLWSSIGASPFASIYIDELYRLARQVVTLAEAVFDATPRGRADDRIQVDHKIMQDLFTLLGSAARIASILKTPGHRRGDQTDEEFEVQRRRATWLREHVLNGVRLSAVLAPKVRHTLEHFDEYLDEAALGFATHRTATPSLVPIDFVVSRRRVLEALARHRGEHNVFFMRVFIASERVFVNCGHDISIEALRVECRRIVKRLAPARGDREEGGSSMLVITDTTFPAR
jgi:hypothetical protein